MRTSIKGILTAAALTLAAGTAQADGWTFLPGLKPGYQPEFSVAVTGGYLSPDSTLTDGAVAYGAEVSMNCALIQPPSNRVRTTVSFLSFDDGGLKLTDIELNPHYVVELSDDFWIGGGPGVGIVKADTSTNDATLLAFQLGASAHYRMDRLFIGGEARYQFTQDKAVGPDNGANNWRALVKVGFNL